MSTRESETRPTVPAVWVWPPDPETFPAPRQRAIVVRRAGEDPTTLCHADAAHAEAVAAWVRGMLADAYGAGRLDERDAVSR